MEETARLTESIKELLSGGREERLTQVLEDAHSADIGSALRELPVPERVHVFRLLPLPHPSGVSRWLNDPAHSVRLDEALAVLRREVGSRE